MQRIAHAGLHVTGGHVHTYIGAELWLAYGEEYWSVLDRLGTSAANAIEVDWRAVKLFYIFPICLLESNLLCLRGLYALKEYDFTL